MITFLPDNLEEAVLQTADFVHKAVRKQYWTEAELEERYLNRTWTEILEEGTTNALGPCPERTLVAAKILMENGFEPVVIYHEWRALGFSASVIHLIIEIPDKLDTQRKVTLEFSTTNTLCKTGAYSNQYTVENTAALRPIPVARLRDSLDDLRIISLLERLATKSNDMRILYRVYIDRGRGRYGSIDEDVLLFEEDDAKLYGLGQVH